MPNVGKSTLLNALRNIGIAGRKFIFTWTASLLTPTFCPMLATPKALRTSAHPGMTRVLSTRLKLSVDPLVYAYDSPGVMLPFLGNGIRGAERGVKLALIGQLTAPASRTSNAHVQSLNLREREQPESKRVSTRRRRSLRICCIE